FGKPWGGNLRIQLFESDSYDSRLYAYENDVLFSSSTPFFFHRGARIYLNLRAKISPGRLKGINIDLGMKLSTPVYLNLRSVGSVPDEIMGNRKSEIKLQVYVMPG